MSRVIIANAWPKYIAEHRKNVENTRAISTWKEVRKAMKAAPWDKKILAAVNANKGVGAKRREAVAVALLGGLSEQLRTDKALLARIKELQGKGYTHLTIDEKGNVVAVIRKVDPTIGKQTASDVQIRLDKYDPVVTIDEILKYSKTRGTNLPYSIQEAVKRQKLAHAAGLP